MTSIYQIEKSGKKKLLSKATVALLFMKSVFGNLNVMELRFFGKNK